MGTNELNSSSWLLQHQQHGSSRWRCPAFGDRTNSGSTRLQVPPCALPVSNEHHTLPTHPLLTGKPMRGSSEIKHKKGFFNINMYLNVLLRLSARLKRKLLVEATLAHICREATGVIPGFSKEWPTHCWWIVSRHFHSYLWLQQLKLPPSLSPGMFLGNPAVAWISTAGGGPSTWGKCFARALCTRQHSWLPLLSRQFTHALWKWKSRSLWTRCLREQESRDQYPAALSMLCSPFKQQSFKKYIRVATFCSFFCSLLIWCSRDVLCLNHTHQWAEWCSRVNHPK